MRNCLLLFGLLLLSTHSYAQWLDPTRPPGVDPASNPSLNLNATLESKNHLAAIINGQLLYPGDIITGFRLLAIENNAVRLQGPDGVFTLPLIDIPVKARATYRTTTQ